MKVCIYKHPENVLINENHAASCWMNIKEGIEDGSITRLENETAEEGGNDNE